MEISIRASPATTEESLVTGELEKLDPAHYTWVTYWAPLGMLLVSNDCKTIRRIVLIDMSFVTLLLPVYTPLLERLDSWVCGAYKFS
jgi:hypothetical protein